MKGQDGNRGTIALLCGLLCDAEIWSGIAGELQKFGEVRIFDFPNFSSMQAMAEHVLTSIAGNFVVVGHSMGGRVALEIVRRSPERVRAVALFNTGTHPPGPHEPESRQRLLTLAQQHGMSALAREWLPPMMGRSTDLAGPLMKRLTRMVERATPETFAMQIHALLSRPDASPVLSTVRVPTLLLSGTDDTWSPPTQHQKMQELCPAAQLVLIERAGHMAPVEQPEKVAATLQSWLLHMQPENI